MLWLYLLWLHLLWLYLLWLHLLWLYLLWPAGAGTCYGYTYYGLPEQACAAEAVHTVTPAREVGEADPHGFAPSKMCAPAPLGLGSGLGPTARCARLHR